MGQAFASEVAFTGPVECDRCAGQEGDCSGNYGSAFQSAIAAMQDADQCRDETLIGLHGGAVVRVSAPLDEVLAWFG